MQDFVHLHLHSEYSLLDGACRVRDIPRAAAEAGHRAVAITDHGVMYGAVAFYKACREEGIKPIIGCEVYVAPRSRFSKEGKADSSGNHLVLLCKNEIGYKNLIAMVSASFTEGFYSKPRIDMDLLRSHKEGLIALSACLAGYIPRMITLGDIRAAEAYAIEMRELFGEDFYLELQDHGIADEAVVTGALCELSEKTGIPLVATNDVHYLKKADADVQATMICIQTNTVIADGRPLGFETDEFYYKSTEEMEALFGKIEGALENSVKIADKCNLSFDFGKVHMPVFPTPDGVSHGEYLASLAAKGLDDHIANGRIDFSYGTIAEYQERIAYELSVIGSMGFDGYYLIVRDFIAYARAHGIPVGPGRGSGAGSMVAFCVGITDIDPIRYGLLFERFLNPERISLPDFDTDICYERRDEVIAYVRERYGEDHVAQIVTFGTMAARAAVRDVGRAMGLPYSEVDAVAKLIPRALGVKIADALRRRELRDMYESSETVRKMIDTAIALEGMPRHASTHAAGVVITDAPLIEHLPIATNGDAVVTQYDMDTVAALGLVKFDLLGLRYLTIISDAERAVREHDPCFDIAKVALEDEAAYRLMADGRTSGVFQLESAGMRQLLAEMRPRTIEDVTAAIALYRPGPMDSIPHYLACRDGREAETYEVPALRSILGDTHGCIVYQEQVMQIFRTLAGYSFAKADLVRRAMSKKKAEILDAEREGFLNGATEHGVPREAAAALFDRMQSFAQYAFNKSHAAAYATLSFRTAYLKAHHPREYLAALLTSVLGDLTKTAEYIAEATRDGIAVLPPDINESRMTFSVSDGNIRFGLLAIRNVGRPFVESILAERERRPFRSFEDFLDRMKGRDLNRRQVEALIKCGAFDRLGVYRSRLLAVYERMIDEILERDRAGVTGQMDIFTMGGAPAVKTEYRYPDIPEFGIRELLTLEKESSGMYFSGHIIEDYRTHMQALSCIPISEILEGFGEEGENAKYTEGTYVTVGGVISRRTNKTLKNGTTMCFVTLEDRYGEIVGIVFPKQLAALDRMLSVDTAVAVKGKLSVKEGEAPELIVSSVTPLRSDTQGAKSVDDGESQRIFLRVPSLDADECRQALRETERYSGSAEIVVYDASSEKYVTVPGRRTAPEPELLERLYRILGQRNVVLR